MMTPKDLTEMRAILEAARACINEALVAWPPDIDLARQLAYDLGYAGHVAEALEAEARRRRDRRRTAN